MSLIPSVGRLRPDCCTTPAESRMAGPTTPMEGSPSSRSTMRSSAFPFTTVSESSTQTYSAPSGRFRSAMLRDTVVPRFSSRNTGCTSPCAAAKALSMAGVSSVDPLSTTATDASIPEQASTDRTQGSTCRSEFHVRITKAIRGARDIYRPVLPSMAPNVPKNTRMSIAIEALRT